MACAVFLPKVSASVPATSTIRVVQDSKIDVASTAKQDSQTEQEPSDIKPGRLDDQMFHQHWSVDVWRDMSSHQLQQNQNSSLDSVGESLQGVQRSIRYNLEKVGVTSDADNVVYWAKHISKFFAFLSLGVASSLFTRIQARGTPQNGNTAQGFGMSITSSPPVRLFLQYARGTFPDVFGMYAQDSRLIREGVYAAPWDLSSLQQRQFNPFFVIDRLVSYLQEASRNLTGQSIANPDLWLSSPLLPDYYQYKFHRQSDGWMSPKSAKVYETSTEALFLGRQDAMQRTSLVHLHKWMAGRGTVYGEGVKMCEIGCGTGRFMTFIKDNYPAMETIGLDLSPFYLSEARNNIKEWKRIKGNKNSNIGPTSFIQAPAESLPFEDEELDVVVSVYMFHEIPLPIREQVLSEAYRVLKPGGMFVFTDSIQFGDLPCRDSVIEAFSSFNEPHYSSYLRTDMGKLFEQAGFECDTKVLGSSTKSLSAIKPLNP